MELVHEKFGTIRVEQANDGAPLFCAADVCRALGYTNNRKAINDHCREKGVTKRYTLSEGGNQEMIFIDEGNLYRLILRSNMPQARVFEDWVCDEVLPQLRKTGKYQMKTDRQTARLIEKETEKAYKQLIAEIKQHIDHTDAEMLAKRLRLNPETVWRVWNGCYKNTSILRELYEYAIKNRAHKELFFTQRGIDVAIRVLRGEAVANQLTQGLNTNV